MLKKSPDSCANGFFGPRIGAHLQMQSESLLEIRRKDKLTLAATRLTCPKITRAKTTPIPSEPAFSILHQLGDLDRHACWLAGRPRYSGAFGAGTVSVTNLMDNPQCEFHGPMDALQYYVPKAALDDFAYEHGSSQITTLEWDRKQRDPFVSTLSSLLLTAVKEERATNQFFIDHVVLSLMAHFAHAYGGMRARGAVAEGGLAPWQLQRAKEIMRARLATALTISDVAAECRLTPSHFARAFRRSAGIAPHQYLSQLRIEEAKRLMTTTQLPLTDIALISGFGDQSYFTRVFSRQVGASPGAWRRTVSNG
jgi:AraC family transcriptional regulator